MYLLNAALASMSPICSVLLARKYKKIRRERDQLKKAFEMDSQWLNNLADLVNRKQIEVGEFGQVVLDCMNGPQGRR